MLLATAVGVPMATLAGALPEQAPTAVAVLGLAVVAAAFDALRCRGRLSGLRFEPEGVLRLSRGRGGELGVRLQNDQSVAREVRVGLPLPRGLTSTKTDSVFRIPPGASRLGWPVQPVERGCHRLDEVRLEAESPWRLWQVRAAVPLGAEVRAYPDLFRDRQAVSAIFLNRGGVGAHAQRQVGKGREFEKLREYIPGDGLDDIHWKATGKRGRPVTKVFQIERTQEVYVILDASRLSARSAGTERPATAGASPAPAPAPAPTASGAAESDERMLDRALTSALLLGAAAERQGDLFGLLTFSDRVRTFVRAGSGAAHYGACRDALYTLEPETVSPDFEEVATFLRNRLRRRALLVFLTSLDDPVIAEGFLRGIDLIRRQHIVCVGMIRPPGARAMFQNTALSGVEPLYGELAGHLRWQNLREVERLLRRRGVGFALADAASLTLEMIRQYMSVKRRQVL